VNHHLIAFARGAGIDTVVERGLREQPERVRLLLLHRRHVGFQVLVASPLVQHLARSDERLHEEDADLRGQAPADRHRTVFVLIHVERAAGILARGLLGLGLGVHPAPTAYDAFDVLGSARATHGQQTLLGLRRGHPGQLTHFRVRELAAGERVRQLGQRAEGAGDPDVLPGCAGREPHAPGKPGGTRAKAVAPAPAGVELAAA
jgi:hypothetical protein